MSRTLFRWSVVPPLSFYGLSVGFPAHRSHPLDSMARGACVVQEAGQELPAYGVVSTVSTSAVYSTIDDAPDPQFGWQSHTTATARAGSGAGSDDVDERVAQWLAASTSRAEAETALRTAGFVMVA